ncbi:MAG TPA: chloramphenicol acetyltransferase [Candidatus Eisenbacteria bacterium]|nr:chloramphenicol acetyltransferase [Candidatus Eisenbacteria bacterium]
MPTYLDLESWPRREQFHFFREYDNPFFNVCVQMDVAALRQLPRERAPFFLTYHYLALKAANEVAPFRYRLRGDRVLVHDTIHIGTTILLDDGERFGFCYFDWDDDFSRFAAQGKAALDALRSSDGRLEPRKDRDDLIHGSVLPWISFTSFAHARKKDPEDSVPKIVFGKVFQDRMPVSVEVHHALMDGVHVGRFLERLQGYFADPAPALGIRSAP